MKFFVKITIPLVFIALGIVLLFEYGNIGFLAFSEGWFGIFLIVLSLLIAINQIIRKTSGFIISICTAGVSGIILTLTAFTDLEIADVWTAFLLIPGFSAFGVYFFRKKSKGLLKLGVFFVFSFCAFTLCNVLNEWILLIPVALIAIGLMMLWANVGREEKYEIPEQSFEKKRNEILTKYKESDK